MSPRFAIVSPCPKKWADLGDEGRTRYCDDCKKSVHPIGGYTPEEVDGLWRETGGHLCACLPVQSTSEHRSRRAVLVGALLTAISPLMAQSGRVRIRVTDPSGAIVPGAKVSQVGSDRIPIQTATSDSSGEAVFANLPTGDCRFVVLSPGFAQRNLTVLISDTNEVKVETTLEISTIGEVVQIVPKRRWWLFLH